MEKLTKELAPISGSVEKSYAQAEIPFKIGDKVTTFDDKSKPVRAVVAWIGKSKEARPDGSYIIGVYTVRLALCLCLLI